MNSLQRVSLHLRCLGRKPGHFRFHLQGIQRETAARIIEVSFALASAIIIQILAHSYQ